MWVMLGFPATHMGIFQRPGTSLKWAEGPFLLLSLTSRSRDVSALGHVCLLVSVSRAGVRQPPGAPDAAPGPLVRPWPAWVSSPATETSPVDLAAAAPH